MLCSIIIRLSFDRRLKIGKHYGNNEVKLRHEKRYALANIFRGQILKKCEHFQQNQGISFSDKHCQHFQQISAQYMDILYSKLERECLNISQSFAIVI